MSVAGLVRNRVSGRTFLSLFLSRFVSAFSLSKIRIFLLSRVIELAGHARVGSLNRNRKPFVVIPRFPIRIGFESHETGRG